MSAATSTPTWQNVQPLPGKQAVAPGIDKAWRFTIKIGHTGLVPVAAAAGHLVHATIHGRRQALGCMLCPRKERLAFARERGRSKPQGQPTVELALLAVESRCRSALRQPRRGRRMLYGAPSVVRRGETLISRGSIAASFGVAQSPDALS